MINLNNQSPIDHRSNYGTMFKAIASLKCGVLVIPSERTMLNAADLAADCGEFGAWHALVVRPELRGFPGYDNVEYRMAIKYVCTDCRVIFSADQEHGVCPRCSAESNSFTTPLLRSNTIAFVNWFQDESNDIHDFEAIEATAMPDEPAYTDTQLDGLEAILKAEHSREERDISITWIAERLGLELSLCHTMLEDLEGQGLLCINTGMRAGGGVAEFTSLREYTVSLL